MYPHSSHFHAIYLFSISLFEVFLQLTGDLSLHIFKAIFLCVFHYV